MSFWHTFVGKAIHHISGGLIGPSNHHHPAPASSSTSSVPSTDIPKECNDLEYFIKNQDTCWSHANTPWNPLPPVPEIPNPGTVVIPPVTPPVSSVPEPSSVVLFIAAMIVVGLFRGFRKKY